MTRNAARPKGKVGRPRIRDITIRETHYLSPKQKHALKLRYEWYIMRHGYISYNAFLMRELGV